MAHALRGVQAHDTRLVATMNAYGITHLLTFENASFTRLPGITIVSPGDV